jgi:hypothetical protein
MMSIIWQSKYFYSTGHCFQDCHCKIVFELHKHQLAVLIAWRSHSLLPVYSCLMSVANENFVPIQSFISVNKKVSFTLVLPLLGCL